MADISNDQRKLLDKIVTEGRLFKLCKKDIKTERDIDNWVNGFIGSFDSKDREVMENHKFLWRKSDKEKGEAPKYGVCADLGQIQWLIDHERLNRTMCGVDLDEWVALKRLTHFQFKEVPKDGDVPGTAVPATGIVEKRALDRVITFLAGKMYVNKAEPGAKAAEYFKDYSKNYIAMDRLVSKSRTLMLDRWSDLFIEGHFMTWADVVNELKEHCGFKTEKENDIVDILKTIKSIAMTHSSEMPMRSKILLIQSELEKWMIIDEDKFIHGQDLSNPNKLSVMTCKEEYTPIINLCIHAMIYCCSSLSEQKWRDAVTELVNKIAEKPSYMVWQKNRNFLYKLLDDRTAAKASQNSVEGTERIDNETEEQNMIRQKSKNSSRGGGRQFNNSYNNFNRNPSGGNRGNRGSFRGANRGLTSRNNFSSPRGNRNYNRQSNGNNDVNNRNGGAKDICNHCSHYAGKKVTHAWPYGGGQKCIFDKSGSRKKAKIFAMNSKEDDNLVYENGNPVENSYSGQSFDNNPLGLPYYGSETQTQTQNQVDHREDIIGYETSEAIMIAGINEDGFVGMDGMKAHGADLEFETLKNEQGSAKMATPILDCKFVNPNKPNEYLHGRLTFDSGAANSMINAQALKYCQWKSAGPRVKRYISAGGDDLKLWNNVVDVAIEIQNQGMFVFKHVLVVESKMIEQVLIGRTDMNRLKVMIDFENQKMRIGIHRDSKWFPMNVQKLESIARWIEPIA